MRVALVSPSAVLGGAERCLVDLVASLRAHDPGLELRALLLAAGPLEAALRGAGAEVEVHALPAGAMALGEGGARLLLRAAGAGPALLAHAGALGARLRALRPDVVHTNGIKAHALSALWATGGAPVVWHVHDFLGSRRLASRVLRLAARRAAAAIAVSHAVARDARAVLPGLPVHVVHDAVDLERFHPGPGDGAWLDALAGLAPAPPGTARVGLVAGYGRWKGHDVLLRATRELLAGGRRDARVFVVGGPLYRTAGSQFSRAELEALATSLGVRDAVGFVPFQDDPAAVYRALDVAVHASTQPEPFGLTIAEAMACGRATVHTEGGAGEVVEGAEAALQVPMGDPDALAAALRRLVDDPALRARLGQRAAGVARARLGRARLGPEVLAVWEQVLSDSTQV